MSLTFSPQSAGPIFNYLIIYLFSFFSFRVVSYAQFVAQHLHAAAVAVKRDELSELAFALAAPELAEVVRAVANGGVNLLDARIAEGLLLRGTGNGEVGIDLA